MNLRLQGSLLNHSCRPNTRPVFSSSHRMRVVATEDVSDDEGHFCLVSSIIFSRQIASGVELTTSYLSPFQTTQRRRAALFRGKGFWCDCQR